MVGFGGVVKGNAEARAPLKGNPGAGAGRNTGGRMQDRFPALAGCLGLRRNLSEAQVKHL